MSRYSSSHTTTCMHVAGWDWYVVDEIGKPLAEAANKTFGGSEMTEAAIYVLEVREALKRRPEIQILTEQLGCRYQTVSPTPRIWMVVGERANEY